MCDLIQLKKMVKTMAFSKANLHESLCEKYSEIKSKNRFTTDTGWFQVEGKGPAKNVNYGKFMIYRMFIDSLQDSGIYLAKTKETVRFSLKPFLDWVQYNKEHTIASAGIDVSRGIEQFDPKNEAKLREYGEYLAYEEIDKGIRDQSMGFGFDTEAARLEKERSEKESGFGSGFGFD